MRGQIYQLFLILILALVGALFGIFLYREVYPEYKIYQNAFVNLEAFRASLTHEPAPDFDFGVKQIVISRPDGGPEIIDRCTSCHVALQISAFSPTKIARDVNGEVVRDENGVPLQVPNPDYLFAQLDGAIHALTDKQANDQLLIQGDAWRVDANLREAEQLKSLKTVEVNGRMIDLKKVFMMHPLIGNELRPFEYHSQDEMGCTVCHNGNGRALTAEKAHGPVFDGEYEPAFEGPKPKFLESNPETDPEFSHIFNHKPGHELLFQTTPLFVGGLIEAKCVQCHQPSGAQLKAVFNGLQNLKEAALKKQQRLQKSVKDSRAALTTLQNLRESIQNQGLDATLNQLQISLKDFTLPQEERDQIEARIQYLKINHVEMIDKDIASLAQSQSEAEQAEADQALESIGNIFQEQQLHRSLTDLDLMTKTFRRGQNFFLSQACYACHRIAGFSRGGVGPDLTQEGFNYPWYIKQKLVWPQGDFKDSTMPQMHLDHGTLESLMTFLLAQQGRPKAISDVGYQVDIKQWETGRKLPWEKPLKPDQIHNLDTGMTIFATEGCAACHRLHGFTSNVGYAIEKREKTPSFDELDAEHQWFQGLIPELVGGADIPGSVIIEKLEKQAQEIDQRIINDARQGSLLEKIESEHPGLLSSFYANFEFAMRHQTSEQWQNRVRRVLMMYIQEYGLGRLIGPRPNWSGIYRSDQWLMEHFYDPSAHTSRSLMPVFPFDETKFACLTYMLDTLGKRNLDSTRAIWEQRGFNPAEAFQIHCSQCHGMSERRDEAPVLPWIYPLPKNLRNATFLRNLTRPRIIESITHGIRGTPMPPWGETPKDKPFDNDIPVLRPREIQQLTDWLFRSLPGQGSTPQEVPKWEYKPEDVLHELQQEGDVLQSRSLSSVKDFIASLTPTSASPAEAPQDISEIFDTAINPIAGGVDQKAYYIKRQYYTLANLQAGQRFFHENCAVCHGNEGAGDGTRATEMEEAKPRMFTNVNWQETRDDLRLLRSIKYGVPGTAMTPWGDLTSSLQRLQLVMYIRELGQTIEAQNRLAEVLYGTFDTAIKEIQSARIQHYASVDQAQKVYERAKNEREAINRKLTSDPTQAQAAVAAYEKEASSLALLESQKAADQLFLDLIHEVQAERTLFEREGKTLLNARADPGIVEAFFNLIRLNERRYHLVNSHLDLTNPNQEQIKDAMKNMEELIDTQIQGIQKEKVKVGGRLTSPEQRAEINRLNAEIKGLEKTHNELTTLVSDAARSRDRQEQIFDQLPVSNGSR